MTISEEWILANTRDFREFTLESLRNPEALHAHLSVYLEEFEADGDIETLKLGIRTAIEAIARANLIYPYVTEPDGEVLMVSFPQFNGVTDARDEEHARERAQGLLDEILASMRKDGEEIPPPIAGEKTVCPSDEVMEALGRYK